MPRSAAELRFEKRMQQTDPNYKLPDVGHIPGPPAGWRDANGQRAYERRVADNNAAAARAKEPQ
jgi:hypothetical protein